MNREQLKSKILREVVILYFDHLLGNDNMVHTDKYDIFFHTWYKKLTTEDIDLLTFKDLENLENDLEEIYNEYHTTPSSSQQLAIHHINHSLEKYKHLQNKAANE